MNSSVSLPPSFAVQSPPLTALEVVVPAVPAELAALAPETVLEGMLLPPETAAKPPVVSVTLPDGKTLEIPAGVNRPVAVQTPVSLKIIETPFENALKVQIKTLPKTALPPVREEPAALSGQAAPPALRPPVLQGSFLNTLPPQAVENLPQEIAPILFEASGRQIPFNTKISFVILPDEGENPAKEDSFAPNQPEGNVNVGEKQASTVSRTEKPEKVPDALFPALQKTGVKEKPASPNPAQNNIFPPDAEVSSENGIIKNVTLLQNEKSIVFVKRMQDEVIETALKIPENPAKTENASDAFSPVLLKKAPETAVQNTPVKTNPPPPVPPLQENETASPAEKEEGQDFPLLKPDLTLKGVPFSVSDDEPMLIATKIGILALNDKVKLPPLLPLTIQITAVEEPFFSDDVSVKTERNMWTVLKFALDSLKRVDETAFKAVKEILPATGNKLPALMLSFMNAAAQNVPLRVWLGEANVAAIQKIPSGEAVLKRLEREFSTSAKKMTDGRTSWHGWDIPLLSGNIVEPVSLFLQRPPEESGRKERHAAPRNAVRFVLDMSLSRLGKIQMEGLAGRQNRRFDLTIRHQSVMPPEFAPTVGELFFKTLDALSYAGNLKIDKTDEFIDLRPEDGNAPAKRGVLV